MVRLLQGLAGELSEDEQRRLADWRAASPENEATYQTYAKVWQGYAPADIDRVPNRQEGWADLEQRLALKRPARPALRLVRRQTWYAVAAVLAIASIGLWLFVPAEAQMIEVVVANGTTETVALPDGSVARVNSGSILRYPEAFADDVRRVELSGEAFFDVVSGQGAFLVQANNAEVEVLGTEFNVWTRQGETRVAVREGRVAVRAAAQVTDELVLAANEAARILGDTAPEALADATLPQAFDWLDGNVVFSETPFQEVVDELVRVYNQPIRFEASRFANETVTGSTSGQSVDMVLQSLCLTLGCSVGTTGDAFTIGE